MKLMSPEEMFIATRGRLPRNIDEMSAGMADMQREQQRLPELVSKFAALCEQAVQLSGRKKQKRGLAGRPELSAEERRAIDDVVGYINARRR